MARGWCSVGWHACTAGHAKRQGDCCRRAWCAPQMPAPSRLRPAHPWQTMALRECMLKHEDYYRPMLEEEEEMLREQEEAEQAAAAGGGPAAAAGEGPAAAAAGAATEKAAEAADEQGRKK